MQYVTYESMFAFTMIIISITGLFITILLHKKK